MKRTDFSHAILRMAFVLVMAALTVSCATPAPFRPVRDLAVEKMKKMIDESAAFTLVDTRTEYEYRKGHIPGATSIPPEKFDELASLLPTDKNAHIVFYCRGSA